MAHLASYSRVYYLTYALTYQINTLGAMAKGGTTNIPNMNNEVSYQPSDLKCTYQELVCVRGCRFCSSVCCVFSFVNRRFFKDLYAFSDSSVTALHRRNDKSPPPPNR